ncbi:peptidoglycan DD-metalloendopeptidase family protein [Parabacteroides pacaensis]|uniref:peptidoglycan DD-metalloendopeptidase family protein n=1 Tax=Parabacteroides pacaensis TaxID=2086575 RepID=UPI000D0F6783|nr:peptidoglycan DD-metalloendopeptidase family protein [Parabacteroides pacaensis]
MKTKIGVKIAGLVCCTFLAVSSVSAGNPLKDNKERQAVPVIPENVNNFIADRVSYKKERALQELATIHSIELKTALDEEAKLFPADELYGSNWENRFVDPFHGKKDLSFPDSCAIDCSTFTLPIAQFTKVTSKYGPRRRRMHKGIDLKVQTGDTIYAAFDGRVRIKSYERRGYGYYLVIRHPNGLETVYGHLSKFIVGVNDYVKAGQPIAYGGNTGRSTGSHLHFETRFLGQPINPAEIIDFENAVPHQDTYVFHNIKVRGRKTNMYTSSKDRLVYHRVKSGETLGKIAKMYGTTVNELCRLNGLKSTSTLRIGQAIRCSNGGGETVSVKSSSQAKSVAKAPTTKDNLNAASVSEPTNNESANQPVYHRIKQGDTLGAIAAKYGTSVNKLCQLNGITPKTILKLGRSLRCS